MRRVATKIVAAAERLGRFPALGTQAVLRCNGITVKSGGKTLVETGVLAIVASIEEIKKEYVN